MTFEFFKILFQKINFDLHFSVIYKHNKLMIWEIFTKKAALMSGFS